MSKNQSSAAKQENPAVSQLGDWSEFIPLYAHYNPHTLINKNGELLQIIKIDGNLLGSPCENLDGVHASVRNTLRHVIAKGALDDKFSFWLHTIRRRVPMAYDPPVAESSNTSSFSEYVDEEWKKRNKWECHYNNEVYLTVLYEGETIPLVDGKGLLSLVFPKANRRARDKYLDESYSILDNFTSSVLEVLRSQCNANRLTLVERAMSNTGKVARPQIFYSEPMEFLGNILNLRHEPFPLPDVDLSVALQTTELSFGFNAIESKSRKTDSHRFAAMLTLKQYIDTYVEAVDCVMQAPIEFIISQCFNFIPADKALKHHKDQKNLFGMSGDIKLNKSFGITKILGFDHNSSVDYCVNQISIMVMSDDIDQLDGEVAKFLNSFVKLGFVTVREDIMMQECFWTQFPGNFEFIRRPASLATEHVAGFCRLNRFHSGSPTGNHWGSSLALIPTSVGSPYFFNFHVNDNGHSVIFDFNSFNDGTGKILEYFLLTQTRKFGARLVVFDRNQSSRLLLSKLSGSYFTMMQLEKNNKNIVVGDYRSLALNPFSLEPSNYNKSFLAAWCGLLISPDLPVDSEAKKILGEVIGKLYELPASERNLPTLVTLLKEVDAALAKPLEKWIGKGEFAGLFDFSGETLDTQLDMVGFDMTPAVTNYAYGLPLFSYLMHRMINSLTGQPTVIVINEAWELLENAFFAPRLESLLEMLKQKNVMVIFTTSKPLACHGTVTLSAIMAGTATQIYVPDDMPVNYKSDDIKLNEYDDVLLSEMQRQKGDFLLKQSGESVVLRFSMNDAEDIAAILSNDIKSLGSARGKFTGVPKDY